MFQQTYEKMLQIVKKKSAGEALQFERADGIEYSLFNYPASKLLELEDDRAFIRESFYKILDRPVDKESLEALFLQLTEGDVSRKTILHSLTTSEEAKLKKTKINWDI